MSSNFDSIEQSEESLQFLVDENEFNFNDEYFYFCRPNEKFKIIQMNNFSNELQRVEYELNEEFYFKQVQLHPKICNLIAGFDKEKRLRVFSIENLVENKIILEEKCRFGKDMFNKFVWNPKKCRLLALKNNKRGDTFICLIDVNSTKAIKINHLNFIVISVEWSFSGEKIIFYTSNSEVLILNDDLSKSSLVIGKIDNLLKVCFINNKHYLGFYQDKYGFIECNFYKIKVSLFCFYLNSFIIYLKKEWRF